MPNRINCSLPDPEVTAAIFFSYNPLSLQRLVNFDGVAAERLMITMIDTVVSVYPTR